MRDRQFHTTTVTLSEESKARIDAIAKDSGTSRSAVVEYLITTANPEATAAAVNALHESNLAAFEREERAKFEADLARKVRARGGRR